MNKEFLLEKCSEGYVNDVRVTFAASLLEAFMKTFGGCSPENVTETYCEEGEVSYQLFHPYPARLETQVFEWLEDKKGELTVTTCYTLDDENASSYCDIWLENVYKNGQFVTWSADFDDTFGDKSLLTKEA